MFIEKLLKENPELVKKAVRKICKIDEKIDKEYRDFKKAYQFEIYSGGSGVFHIEGQYSSDGWTHNMKVYLEDFSLLYTDDTQKGGVTFCQCSSTIVETEWIKFMIKACADSYEYIQAFIKFRDIGLKEYESRYNSAGEALKKYKDETENILAEIGFCEEQNQTR